MATPRQNARVERDAPDSAPVVARIRAEFDALPGLCLTLRQAARLWHLDAAVCQQAMEVLVRDGVLRCSRDRYERTPH